MAGKQVKQQLTSIGFHYYQDSEHYRDQDLKKLLAVFQKFEKKPWIVLQSEVSRGIPEFFLKGLHSIGIQTIIQINVHVMDVNQQDISLLLHQYGEWGVACVQLAGMPNVKNYWGKSWLKVNVAEEFIRGFIEFGNQAIAEGVTPLMSTLLPGGDFWDTVFLRTVLKRLLEEKEINLAQKMGLTAGGWTYQQVLGYGRGGHDVWSEVKPYQIPGDSESQLGLHTYEWYLEIAREVVGKNLPIFITNLGAEFPNSISETPASLAQKIELVSEYLFAEEGIEYGEWIPAGIFCGLSEMLNSENSSDGNERLTEAFEKIAAKPLFVAAEKKKSAHNNEPANRTQKEYAKVISHYLLLPVYEWGVADWHLEVIKPYVRNHQPTIGFSKEEAKYAEKVTIVGDETVFGIEIEKELQAAGCEIERISGDGTDVASQMAER